MCRLFVVETGGKPSLRGFRCRVVEEKVYEMRERVKGK